MKKVVVDGEGVIFGEMCPQKLPDISTLMEALSEQARVIYSIEVDGEPATGTPFLKHTTKSMW